MYEKTKKKSVKFVNLVSKKFEMLQLWYQPNEMLLFGTESHLLPVQVYPG